MSTCSREAAMFYPHRSVLMRLELAFFAGKISKNRLVCKNAVALAHYGSCRLLVMGSWSDRFFIRALLGEVLGDAMLMPMQMNKNASLLSENWLHAPIFEITSIQVSLLNKSLQVWQNERFLIAPFQAQFWLVLKITEMSGSKTTVSRLSNHCVCQLGMRKSTSILGHLFGFCMVARFPTAGQGERRLWVRGYRERQNINKRFQSKSVLTSSLELSCPYKYHKRWLVTETIFITISSQRWF